LKEEIGHFLSTDQYKTKTILGEDIWMNWNFLQIYDKCSIQYINLMATILNDFKQLTSKHFKIVT
jgi:hypothetical protein